MFDVTVDLKYCTVGPIATRQNLCFLISIFDGFDSGRSDLAVSAGSHGNLSPVAGLIFGNRERGVKALN